MPLLAQNHHLSAPKNQTLISSGGRDLAELSLQRAGAMSLQLRLRVDELERAPGLPGLIDPFIGNAKILHFSRFKTTEVLGRLFPGFRQPMPKLRSLLLHGLGPTDHEYPADPLLLPQALRSLSLAYVHLSPSFLHLKGLTELALKIGQFDLSLDALLNFVDGNHALQRAALHVRFANPVFRTSQRGGIVTMG